VHGTNAIMISILVVNYKTGVIKKQSPCNCRSYYHKFAYVCINSSLIILSFDAGDALLYRSVNITDLYTGITCIAQSAGHYCNC